MLIVWSDDESEWNKWFFVYYYRYPFFALNFKLGKEKKWKRGLSFGGSEVRYYLYKWQLAQYLFSKLGRIFYCETCKLICVIGPSQTYWSWVVLLKSKKNGKMIMKIIISAVIKRCVNYYLIQMASAIILRIFLCSLNNAEFLIFSIYTFWFCFLWNVQIYIATGSLPFLLFFLLYSSSFPFPPFCSNTLLLFLDHHLFLLSFFFFSWSVFFHVTRQIKLRSEFWQWDALGLFFSFYVTCFRSFHWFLASH